MSQGTQGNELSLERSPILVYLDSGCFYCRLAGRIVTKLDRDRAIRITSYRTDGSFVSYGLTPEDVDRELCAISVTDTVERYKGLDAIIEVCRRAHGLRGLVPFLLALRKVRLGNTLYRILADHRPRKRQHHSV